MDNDRSYLYNPFSGVVKEEMIEDKKKQEEYNIENEIRKSLLGIKTEKKSFWDWLTNKEEKDDRKNNKVV